MTLIRARQRALTQVSPHQGNRVALIPPRSLQPRAPAAGLPVLVTPPLLTGSGSVAAALTVDNGIWSPAVPAAGSPTRFAYRWKADGVLILGAAGSSYIPITAQIGASITAEVLGTYGGLGAWASSNAIPVIP